MNCLEFETLWNEALDQRSDGSSDRDRALEAHANSCVGCRSVASRFQVLGLALAAVGPVPVPSVGSADRIVARLALEQKSIRRRRLSIRTVLATAASLLGLATIYWVGRPAAGPDPSLPIAVGLPPRPPRPLGAALAVARSASIELAREASAPAARIGLEVLDGLARTEIPGQNGTSTPESVVPYKTVGERVNASVRPISGSARHAFSFLLGPPRDSL